MCIYPFICLLSFYNSLFVAGLLALDVRVVEAHAVEAAGGPGLEPGHCRMTFEAPPEPFI